MRGHEVHLSTSRPIRVTVSGPDAPGITAALTKVVADAGVPLDDIEQVVLRGKLTLCLHLALPTSAGPEAQVLKELLFAAQLHGCTVNFESTTGPVAVRHEDRYAITVMAPRIEAGHLRVLSETLADYGANILAIERLSEPGLSALEIRAELPDHARFAPLRHRLLEVAIAEGVDLAVQREGLLRRSKRFVAMDMDSTLIQVEVIDELAKAHGVVDKVSELTREAMAGNLDYEESLRRRVKLLKGLPVETVHKVAADLPFTPGAEALVRVFRRLGYKTAVISGGFDIAARRVKDHLKLDYAHSNKLEIRDGLLTGGVIEPIVTPDRKAELLADLADENGIALDQTIAIGDGANDLGMIELAGLGIAFHAKSKLREAADTALNHRGGLDRVLYLLGFHASEVKALLDPS
ncbi:MAG: phosphoserine phosphatase SerB [Proteobacteria bacterium]|nr:phosphoserine phosphatase SerB [Pseudomonadota bacterium]